MDFHLFFCLNLSCINNLQLFFWFQSLIVLGGLYITAFILKLKFYVERTFHSLYFTNKMFSLLHLATIIFWCHYVTLAMEQKYCLSLHWFPPPPGNSSMSGQVSGPGGTCPPRGLFERNSGTEWTLFILFSKPLYWLKIDIQQVVVT